MLPLASPRVRNVLPDKRIICGLIILALSLLGCGGETGHVKADKYPSMHSKSGLTIKKPTVSYPMEKVDIHVSQKLTGEDKLEILLDGKTAAITDRNERFVSFRGPYNEGYHHIVLIKNGVRSNKTGLNVIAYH
ncbi:MAG: hypothetical protein PVG41_04540 [Desulfobacteraceae bacterium]